MKYFLTSVEYDHSITGIPNSKIHAVEAKKPQCFKNEDERAYFYNGFPQLSWSRGSAKYDPAKISEITFLPVGKRIKEIDVIRHCPGGIGDFIISKRAWEIFRQFKLPEHNIVPVKIDTFTTDYFLVGFFPPIEPAEIDFTQSVFYDADSPRAAVVGYELRAEDKKQIIYNSYEEYKEAMVWKKAPIEIHLHHTCNDDIICIRMTCRMYFSEKLASAIEENKIVGFNVMKEIILINDI